MKKFFSNFATLSTQRVSKKKQFAIFNGDGENRHYVKELIKEIKSYPKLKELNARNLINKKLSQIDPGDVIVFGDTTGEFKYDYRVVEIEDIVSTNGFEVLDLSDEYKKVVRAIKAYHKANYPEEHKVLTSRFSPRVRQQEYYSLLSGRHLKDLELNFEIPTGLLRKYPNIELEIEFPKKLKKVRNNTVSLEKVIEAYYPKKKKVAKKNYVVHQNLVKAGLKAYNIYKNKHGAELTTISGKDYFVVRRSGKKDYLVSA